MENAVEDSSLLCLSTPNAKPTTSEMHLPEFRIHKEIIELRHVYVNKCTKKKSSLSPEAVQKQ